MVRHFFEDRLDAGQQLASVLKGRQFIDPVVIALPRGGVPVAKVVAKALKAPLDLILVRKIGAASNRELAVAAVTDGNPHIIEVDETTLSMSGTTLGDVRNQVPDQVREIARRRQLYLKGREPLPLKGKTAILVDDGIATGTTMRAAVKALQQRQPARVVVAIPVGPADEIARLRLDVDEVICLAEFQTFGAVGEHYQSFDQTTDEEVVAIMAAQDDRGGRHD